MQEFKQRVELNYNETFSSIVKSTKIYSSGWAIRKLDVKNAFLDSILCEEIYMQQPPSFSHLEFMNHMYCVRKAIYGLKQAQCALFHCFNIFLLSLGFTAVIPILYYLSLLFLGLPLSSTVH